MALAHLIFTKQLVTEVAVDDAFVADGGKEITDPTADGKAVVAGL